MGIGWKIKEEEACFRQKAVHVNGQGKEALSNYKVQSGLKRATRRMRRGNVRIKRWSGGNWEEFGL